MPLGDAPLSAASGRTLPSFALSFGWKVFLPCVSHRFLRLSLQCIARIGAWAGSREVHALPADDIVPISSGLDK